MTRFRIIPRTAHYKPYGNTKPSLADTEAILFLPDVPANPGHITCYARIGEHEEASLAFYASHTSPPDRRGQELFDWYVKNKCQGEQVVEQKRLGRKRIAP